MDKLFYICAGLILVMSIVAFCFYANDKKRARNGAYRISERTLLLLALAFGAPGALIGMYVLRHKTLKKKFTLTVPFLFIIEMTLLIWLAIKAFI